MNNSGVQRIVPIILILIVIVVAVAAVFTVGKNIFGGGTATPPQSNQGKQSLTNTASDRSVRITVRGPIVGDENFHSYTITVSPNSRNLTTYQGYLANQVSVNQTDNTVKGYEEFTYALDRQKLMDADELTGDANDLRGACATGRLYVYEVMQASNVIKTLWTSSCDATRGSLKASNTVVSRLFMAQVPDASNIVAKVKL